MPATHRCHALPDDELIQVPHTLPRVTTLMIYAGTAPADAPATRTGGLPLVPAGFGWPTCRECEGPMQFLAQIRLDDLDPRDAGLLSIFMCQNDPGLCDEWDPTAGGNAAYVFPAEGLAPAAVPTDGETLLAEVSAVRLVVVEAPDYDAARDHWATVPDRRREVLGQVGGEPGWLQQDETPDCPGCGTAMSFVAQLEEGHDHRTDINFGGGGCGYGFRCTDCATAAFLWQR